MILAAAALLVAAAPSYRVLDDAALIALAASRLEPSRLNGRDIVGRYRGIPIIREYHCSDVCPNYTVRIIHFDVEAGASCRAIDGRDLMVSVPSGIAALPRSFCVPAVLSARAVRHR